LLSAHATNDEVTTMRVALRNVLAVLAGLVVGSVVNMALVTLGPSLIPPPAGVDASSAASLAAAIHLFEPRHFLTPFLAHALGTLAGALIAFLLAVRHRAAMAFAIGAVFLAGGIAASILIPAPAWFIVTDLVLAYLPMAWLGVQLGRRIRPAA
jgi:hypothetical protein